MLLSVLTQVIYRCDAFAQYTSTETSYAANEKSKRRPLKEGEKAMDVTKTPLSRSKMLSRLAIQHSRAVVDASNVFSMPSSGALPRMLLFWLSTLHQEDCVLQAMLAADLPTAWSSMSTSGTAIWPLSVMKAESSIHHGTFSELYICARQRRRGKPVLLPQAVDWVLT